MRDAERKRISTLIIFKILLLQHLSNLSDDEFDSQGNNPRSFEDFVGLGVMNLIPDATTLAFFRERLRYAGVIEELFELFGQYLHAKCY
jgi:IS5 family transposase